MEQEWAAYSFDYPLVHIQPGVPEVAFHRRLLRLLFVVPVGKQMSKFNDEKIKFN